MPYKLFAPGERATPLSFSTFPTLQQAGLRAIQKVIAEQKSDGTDSACQVRDPETSVENELQEVGKQTN